MMELGYRSILTRILAAENLHVVVDKDAPTAAFDLRNRVVIIPQFKQDISPHAINRFICHEAAHAIFTPVAEYTGAIESQEKRFRGLFSTILNVCEDPRIDSAMVNKFPGVMRYFMRGVQWLDDNMDFYGRNKTIKSQENNEYVNLLDLLNVLCKSERYGTYDKKVSFKNAEERSFASRIMRTTSYQEVLKLAEDIFEYLKQDKEFMKKFEEAEEQAKNEQEMLGKLFQSVSSFMEGLEKMLQNPGAMANLSATGGAETFNVLIDGSGKSGARHSENSNSKNPGTYVSQTTDVSVVIPVLPMKLRKINPLITKTGYKHDYSAQRIIASQLFSEFQRKKAGMEHVLKQETRTGLLDINQLHNVKMKEDIFKKSTAEFIHKNHACLILLDMSSSMTSYCQNVKNWVFVLTDFMRRLDIPFEIHGFYSSSSYKNSELFKQNLKTVSSRQVDMSVHMAKFYNNRTKPSEVADVLSGIHFSGATPLNEGLIYMRSYAKMYFEAHGKDINNFIVITDGDANGINFHSTAKIIDAETKIHINNPKLGTTGKMMELLKRTIPNINPIGIRIVSPNQHGIQNLNSHGFSKINDKDSIYNDFYYVNSFIDTKPEMCKNFIREFSDDISGYRKNFSLISL